MLTPILQQVLMHRDYQRWEKAMAAGATTDSSSYDSAFKKLGKRSPFLQHYADSPYYFVWAVIADRVRGADSVFEIGCGTGQLARLLWDQGQRHYVGIDFSPEAVRIARQRNPAIDFRVDDARTTSLFGELAAAVVIATEVLEHVPDDLDLLTRIPCGTRILATVPDFPFPGHLRYFPSVASVHGRYMHLVADMSVVAYPKGSAGSHLFLLDGHVR
jgi:SAM-dependent methyltransferase